MGSSEQPAAPTKEKPFQAVGRLEDFPLGAIRTLQLDGKDVGIVRTAEAVFAIGNTCPHQGGPICAGRVTGTMLASDPDQYIYEEDDLVVRCPWHGYEFYIRSGESVGRVIRGRIQVYAVEVREGVVYCSLRRAQPRDPA
jgi:nitrite reductase/ring-hydroxylating ferredoxin subunit